jgi:uncharacterized protein YuzE
METLKIAEAADNTQWQYDAGADVLYISLGDPRPALGVDVGDGTIVRIDPRTNEVVGVTVIGLRKRLLDSPEEE